MLIFAFISLALIGLSLSLARTTAPNVSTAPLGSLSKTCIVKAGGSNLTDDAPAVIEAFQDCGQDGKVIFANTTYYINSVMNTTGLSNCEVDIRGTLLWSTDIAYWLNHSMPIGYQNQSTAWFFGGNNIRFTGNGYGTLNGNGAVWYSFIDNQSNYPGRPHQITFWGLNNSLIESVNFITSQMWTMSILYSHNSTFDNIYVNNTPADGPLSSNTDGADTFYSSRLTFSRWTVDNSDDSISLKANSTDMLIRDSKFYRGSGVAIGSIGQYKGRYEYIDGLLVKNLECYNTDRVIYFKTWTGDQVGYPPNGGGGGLGYAAHIYTSNVTAYNVTSAPFSITQCISYNGGSGNCTDSQFNFRDLAFSDIKGTIVGNTVGSFQCSGVNPCDDIGAFDINLKNSGNGTDATGYLCGNVEDTRGFNCTGPACDEASGSSGC